MIDYGLIAAAVDYYQKCGFIHIDVPWIVPSNTLEITKPREAEKAQDFVTFAGSLVASAEQGFLQMMLENQLAPNRYVSVSPCFRDEPVLSVWTRQYFMKVELIDTRKTENYQSIQECAKRFLGSIGIESHEVQTEQGSDLFAFGVELGSYGTRQWKHLQWNYGTGLAEPRTSLIRKGQRP